MTLFVTIKLGGCLCCLSSFPFVWDEDAVPKGSAGFYLALIGQAITGIAGPFICSVPTKVGLPKQFEAIKQLLMLDYYLQRM